jgi:peptidoglycan L-alanyl-D-glutamate endopeptidase CwlK
MTSQESYTDSCRIEDLLPELARKAERILRQCEEAGLELHIRCTWRPLEKQAVLYRASHTREQVTAKIALLRQRRFGFLADILLEVGPQPTSKRAVTNAAPGESWHNYGEAFDAVPVIGGQEMWNYNDAPFEWDMYGQLVREAGLTWGGDWRRLRDFPHAQLRAETNPLKVMTAEEVRAVLRGRDLRLER